LLHRAWRDPRRMNPADPGNRRGTGFAGPLAAPPWGKAPKALRGRGHFKLKLLPRGMKTACGVWVCRFSFMTSSATT